MSMEDILKVLVDSRQQGNAGGGGQDPMSALIGGLLGGGQQGGEAGSGAQDPMSALVGGLMGNAQSGMGQQQPGLSGMMGLLENVMGGGTGMGASDPIMALLQPFVTPLAKKAKISPEIAMIVVSFVAHKLLAHHPTSERDSNTFDLDDMLTQMSSGKIDQNMLQSSGMVRELSAKTGLDEATAAQSLGLAFTLVGKGGLALKNKATGKTAGKSASGVGGRSGVQSGAKSAGRTIKR